MRRLQFSARVKPHSDLVLEAPFLFAKLLFAEDHIVIDSEESVRFVDFSDMPNVRLCLEHSMPADLQLEIDDEGEYIRRNQKTGRPGNDSTKKTGE